MMRRLQNSMGAICSIIMLVMCAGVGQLTAAVNFSFPQVVEDGTGKRVALFEEQDSAGNFVIKGSIWTSGSGWSTPVALSTVSRSAFNPIMSVNKTTGHVLAAWGAFDLSAGVDFIEAVMYPVGGDWGTTYTLSETSEDAAFGDHKMTLDDADTAVVMWTKFDPTTGITSIRATTGTFGSAPGWATPTTVAAGQS